MNKRTLGLILLCSAAGLVLGLVLSHPIAQRQRDGAFTDWESYGAPPEPARRILGHESGERAKILVRVEADSGQEYHCCNQGPGEWQAAAPSDLVYDNSCLELPPQAPAPPGPVVECVEVGAYEWGTFRTQFALLADGTIWTWEIGVGIAPEVYFIFWSTIAGLLLGACLALAAWLLGRRRRISG
jgi:hypothetical protein